MQYRIEGKQDKRILAWTNLEDVKRAIKRVLMNMIEAKAVEAQKIMHYLNLKREVPVNPVKKNKMGRLIRNIVYLFKPLNRVLESESKSRPEKEIPNLESIQNIYKSLIDKAVSLLDQGYIEAKVEEVGETGSSLYAAYRIDLVKQKIWCILGIDIRNQKSIELYK